MPALKILCPSEEVFSNPVLTYLNLHLSSIITLASASPDFSISPVTDVAQVGDVSQPFASVAKPQAFH